jgi:hypothetical protein
MLYCLTRRESEEGRTPLRMPHEGGDPMDLELARRFLLACALINYGFLMAWFLVFASAHDWIQRLHGRWFRLSSERFDALHYGGMAVFKIGVLLFNVVPLVSLWIVG